MFGNRLVSIIAIDCTPIDAHQLKLVLKTFQFSPNNIKHATSMIDEIGGDAREMVLFTVLNMVYIEVLVKMVAVAESVN